MDGGGAVPASGSGESRESAPEGAGGAAPVAGDNTSPAKVSEDKSGGAVPAPGTAGDSGAAARVWRRQRAKKNLNSASGQSPACGLAMPAQRCQISNSHIAAGCRPYSFDPEEIDVLLSMTGFGESHQQDNGLAVVVEVRTINNRYFKFTMRTGEGYSALESRVESLVREQMKRGTVQVSVQVERNNSPDDFSINLNVLESYRQQLQKLQNRAGLKDEVPLQSFLLLPGVVKERLSDPTTIEADWLVIERTLKGRWTNWKKCAATKARQWRPI